MTADDRVASAELHCPADDTKPEPEQQKRYAAILFEIESFLSDWGLHHEHDIRDKLLSDDQIHLSHLLLNDRFANLETNISEIQTAFRQIPSKTVALDESGFHVRRLSAISTESRDWEASTIYLENLPPLSFLQTLPCEIREYIAALLECTVQTIRLPLFLYQNAKDYQHLAAIHVNADGTTPSDVKKRRLKLPQGGGPYKNFAVAILDSPETAQKAARSYPWKVDSKLTTNGHKAATNHDDDKSDDDSATASPVTLGRRHGLRILPLAEWHKLRAEYLGYQRALDKVIARAEDEAYYSKSGRHDDRYTSRRREDHKSKRSDNDREEPKETGADWRAARNATLAEEDAYTKEMADAGFPEACVVRIDHVHPDCRFDHLKQLAQDLVRRGGGADIDKALHIETNRDRQAFIRLSTPGAAVAVKLFLQDGPYYMLSGVTDQVSKLATAPSDTAAAALQAEILAGQEEKDFWARQPLTVRQKRAPMDDRRTYSDRQKRVRY